MRDTNIMNHKSIFACLLSLVLMLSFVPMTGWAADNRDISDQVVESIVTRNYDGTKVVDSVTVWEDFRVEVAFSEDDETGNRKPDIDIQSGDRIHISWTAPEEVSFIGFSNTIDLAQDGVVIATAVISESGATITFNDNVNNLQHVRGTLNFSIQTKRVDTYEEAKDATIVAGQVIKTITVNPSTASAPGKFGEKSGAYATDGTNTINLVLGGKQGLSNKPYRFGNHH